MQRYLLLLLVLLLAGTAFSQQNFISGYVIGNDGDSIHGLIDYQNWTKNPRTVAFKPGGRGGMEILDRASIREFGVENDKYISAVVWVESSPRTVNALHDHDSLNYRKDTVFLQVLVQGQKSLYSFCDHTAEYHLYIGEEGNPQALGYKLYMATNPSGEFVMKNKAYEKQLADYLRNWPEVIDKLKVLNYHPNPMTGLFEDYYKFSQAKPDYVYRREKPKLHFQILGGLSYSNLNFSSVNPSLDNAKFSSSLFPTGGLGVELTIPRSRQKLSIVGELMLAHHDYLGRYIEIENSQDFEDHFFVVNTTYLKFNVMIRYGFPLSFGKVFADFGFSNGLSSNLVQQDSSFKTLYGPPTLSVTPIVDDPRSSEQGLFAGLGLARHKLSLECRLERGNGFSSAFGTGARSNRLWAILGWRF